MGARDRRRPWTGTSPRRPGLQPPPGENPGPSRPPAARRASASARRRPRGLDTHAETILAGGDRVLPGDLAVPDGRRAEPVVPGSGDVLAHRRRPPDALLGPADRDRPVQLHLRRPTLDPPPVARRMRHGRP